MNPFDLWVLRFLNQFSQRFELLDRAVGYLSDNLLLNGGMITALLWWAWDRNTPRREKDREYVLAGLLLATLSVAVARTLALLLPFRQRPRAAIPGFRVPIGGEGYPLIHWSAFLSDHAAMYFALATILFLISRRIGLLAYGQATFVVCIPLLYFGNHYPTDLLGGMLIGAGTASLALNDRLRQGIARPASRWLARSPSTFYPTLYLYSLLTATQFDAVRTFAFGIWKVLKR